MAVADQPHVTIPKGPEEAHTPKMKQTMHERKKLGHLLALRFRSRNHNITPTFKI